MPLVTARRPFSAAWLFWWATARPFWSRAPSFSSLTSPDQFWSLTLGNQAERVGVSTHVSPAGGASSIPAASQAAAAAVMGRAAQQSMAIRGRWRRLGRGETNNQPLYYVIWWEDNSVYKMLDEKFSRNRYNGWKKKRYTNHMSRTNNRAPLRSISSISLFVRVLFIAIKNSILQAKWGVTKNCHNILTICIMQKGYGSK
jgi:hypothetical protein